ncbi:MAG: LysM peptidoglycan-binding domain-containing protein [Candidatus Fermentibacteraceae bacterium]|nr:LysM peptidoglycan-binding domain-containing protein [Candidatus Fermentibacteraceae bacterium]MBN2609857.1 LysM peptidoglycan-binding domain-containing protein [Candidatus Fermentibacteraceae bacterium]
MLLSCSGSRITSLDHRNENPRPPSSVDQMVLPVLQGGVPAGFEAPSTDIPASLAAMSDIQYSPEQFPGSGDIKDLVEQILRSEGVPREVAALVWIESNFTVGCYSRVGAAGPWQLMPTTGRELGLEINDTVDERYSWVASTRAAARYLRHLYNIFEDWSLAIAAYNCGPGRVQAGLRQGGNTFGEIELPGETDAFVPRFASAAEAYVQVDLESDGLAVVWVPADFDLRLLAAEIGLDIDSLMDLNRSYLLERTPAEKDAWEVVVPMEYAGDAFNAAWSMDQRRYVVKEGDTWDGIASSLGVSAQVLMGMNPAGSLQPGVCIDIPETQRQPVNAGYVENPQFIRYTVRMGDTLGEIASTVGVSSREVAQWNEMSPDDTIFPGDVLLLRRSGETPVQAETCSSALPTETEINIVSGGGRVTHTVVEGDTLWDLAMRYGVSIEQIMYLNSLENSILSLGEVLVIIPE